MAVKVNCPECNLARLVMDEQMDTEVTCAGCAGTFVPDGGPPRRRPRRERDEDDRPRRRDDNDEKDDRPWRRGRRDEDGYDDRPRRQRYGGRRRRDPIAERLNVPAIFLMVVALIQVLVHLGISVLFIMMTLTEPQGGRGEADEQLVVALVVVIIAAVLMCKDAVVLFGVAAMRQGRGHGRAVFGGIAALCPDAGWIFALAAGIWCLVVLNDPRVKAAFAENRASDF